MSPRLWLCAVVFASAACSPGAADFRNAEGVDGGAASSLDDQVLAAVRSDGFHGAGFVQVNRAAYPTELDMTETINLYVSAGAAAAYRQVHPETTGSGVSLPPGTIIVREVLDGSARAKLTVMAKGSPGYFPGGGDWYYAVLTADGSAFVDGDDGAPIHGAYAACTDCHTDRAGDDFLFGVPADMLAP